MLAAMKIAPLAVALLAAAAIATAWSAPAAHRAAPAAVPVAAPRPALGLSTPHLGPTLPPGARHGLAQRLRQYPEVALATPRQRAAAEGVLAQLRASAARWRNPRAAAAAGFDIHRPRS